MFLVFVCCSRRALGLHSILLISNSTTHTHREREAKHKDLLSFNVPQHFCVFLLLLLFNVAGFRTDCVPLDDDMRMEALQMGTAKQCNLTPGSGCSLPQNQCVAVFVLASVVVVLVVVI